MRSSSPSSGRSPAGPGPAPVHLLGEDFVSRKMFPNRPENHRFGLSISVTTFSRPSLSVMVRTLPRARLLLASIAVGRS